jgi:hypothetical protein
MPEGASKDGDAGAQTKPPDKTPKSGPKYWSSRILVPLTKAFRGEDLAELEELHDDPWVTLLKNDGFLTALANEDRNAAWSSLEEWLVDENYPSAAIEDLRDSLTAQGVLEKKAELSEADLDVAMGQLGVITEDFVPKAARPVKPNPLRQIPPVRR